MTKRNDSPSNTFTVILRETTPEKRLHRVPNRFTKSGRPRNQEARTLLKIIRAGMKALGLSSTVVRVSFD
jgi:hypothetical protein